MTQPQIMTAEGPLEPFPKLSRLINRLVDPYFVRFAKGDNGYWYMNIEDVDTISECICQEHHQPVKRFATFIVWDNDGQKARGVWNKRLGAGKELQVHGTTAQRGFEGTWAIYDLGQTFAGHVDPQFRMRVEEVYRQVETGLYHDDEQPALRQPSGVLSLDLIVASLAHHVQAHQQEMVGMRGEVREVRDTVTAMQDEVIVVKNEVNGLKQHIPSLAGEPPKDWVTLALFLRQHGFSLSERDFRYFRSLIKQYMAGRSPVPHRLPNYDFPAWYYPPDVVMQAWQHYQNERPQLF